MDCPDCEALILEVDFVDCTVEQFCDSRGSLLHLLIIFQITFLGASTQEPAFAVPTGLDCRHKRSRISAGLVVETQPPVKSRGRRRLMISDKGGDFFNNRFECLFRPLVYACRMSCFYV